MNPPQLNHHFFSCTLLYSVYAQLQCHLLHSHAIVVCGSPFFSKAPHKRSAADLYSNHLQLLAVHKCRFKCFCFSLAFLYTWSTCRVEFISLTLQYPFLKTCLCHWSFSWPDRKTVLWTDGEPDRNLMALQKDLISATLLGLVRRR